MNHPPPLPRKTAKSSWVAIVTTLAYPGTGQFLQGRRAVATVLTAITTCVFLWGVESILRGFFEGMDEVLRGGPSDAFAAFRYIRTPVKALALCYLVCFLDAVIAHFILSRRARAADFQ